MNLDISEFGMPNSFNFYSDKVGKNKEQNNIPNFEDLSQIPRPLAIEFSDLFSSKALKCKAFHEIRDGP
jgi:hypothetical protein